MHGKRKPEMQVVAPNDRCRLRGELAEQFAITARLYSEAVVRLTRHESGKYDELLAAAIEAQRRVEAAQTAFQEHVESHGCGTVERQIHPTRERMRSARMEYKRVSDGADAKLQLALDLTGNPDGTLALTQANDAQRESLVALERYREALADCAEAAIPRGETDEKTKTADAKDWP